MAIGAAFKGVQKSLNQKDKKKEKNEEKIGEDTYSKEQEKSQNEKTLNKTIKAIAKIISIILNTLIQLLWKLLIIVFLVCFIGALIGSIFDLFNQETYKDTDKAVSNTAIIINTAITDENFVNEINEMINTNASNVDIYAKIKDKLEETGMTESDAEIYKENVLEIIKENNTGGQ